MTFDATDKKYQISKDFPPNKESTWAYPKEKDGWVHAHNSIRYEMKELNAAFRAIQSRGQPLTEWEIQCIKSVWESHEIHVHAHHSNEDDHFVPFLKTRFVYPEQAETDHIDLVNKMDKLNKIVNGLKAGASVDTLCNEMESYIELMLPHLKHEEDECLPLMRAYFVEREFFPIFRKVFPHSPKVELGSFIVAMGVDTYRKEFLPQMGIPGIVWFLVMKSKVKYFQKVFVRPIEALKTGNKDIARLMFDKKSNNHRLVPRLFARKSRRQSKSMVVPTKATAAAH